MNRMEYLMSGSPRTYPTTSSCKAPKSPAGVQMSGGGPSSKDFLQPGDTAGLAPASKTSTVTSQHRLAPQLMASPPQLSVAPANTIAMPVFPLRSAPSPYSPYSPSRFHIDKRCQHRCSWKCCSIALILLSVALTAMLAYFGAVSSTRPGLDSTSCILVEDARAVAQDEEPRDVTSSQSPTEESLPTSTAVHSSGHSASNKLPGGVNAGHHDATDQQQTQQQIQQQQQQWPAVLEMRELGIPHSATIPPFQFWNSEFRNKEPAFIRLNFTLPWGANFAVYGRRNVAPSVTQYDFVEFVKGGRIDHRLKRSLSGTSYITGDGTSLDAMVTANDMVHYHPSHVSSISAVSFTTSTTQNWRDHRIIPGSETLHVIPPPPFIVNHNHLERSPQSQEDNSEGVSEGILSSSPTYMKLRKPHDLHNTKGVSSRGSNHKLSQSVKGKTKETRHRGGEEGNQQRGSGEVQKHKVGKRSSGTGIDGSVLMLVNVTLLQYLDTGRWFLSVYNDDLRPHQVTLVVAAAEGVSTACPNDCSGHGSCYLGKCDCIDGYEGVDCSKSVCPVLCSNHGKYGGGLCHCEEGWKGPECDIPEHDCQVPDCSGHGQCLAGVCICQPGWKGTICEQVDCPDPNCSGHGSCVGGKCYCKAGWQGTNCSAVDQQVYQCLPGCSEHGSYDLETGACVCDNYWAGPDCSQALCSLDCGPHGHCDKGRCECHKGWTGDRCDLLPCDPRCSEHGQCKNGTCVCSQGWNGKHCTLPGCKSACNRHGTCALEDGEYHCVCSDGWAGLDCSIRLEMECNDEIDNDEDGMIDCSDSECCSHPSCNDHIMCLASNDPVEVLLRKQPPSVTASFYQRVKFLIEEKSVQSYAHMDEYSESQFWNSFTPRRVSVMRGQVVTPQGLGIVGIRVSVDRDSRFGFTLTRAGGWFDVLVNGGGAVTLQFQRSPFLPLTRTVFVPWNQIVVLPPVAMQLSDDTDIYRDAGGNSLPYVYSRSTNQWELPRFFRVWQSWGSMPVFPSSPLTSGEHGPCMDHDHEMLHPVVMSTWMPDKVGGMPGKSLVFAETQILQESIRIPGSSLHLMYQSSQAPGYLSSVLMRLTDASIPPTLTHVHVRVEIEGSVHTKTYEADPHLVHTFAWNKRNVYKQKVYGVAQARISVGYQYSSCPAVVWETQTATLQGFDVDISDVGGWSLDIHHHYNFHEGILQKGDGSTLHFKQYPRTVKVVMGTGLQRQLLCTTQCNGAAKDSRLLTPVALTSGPDGSLYVGDFNLVRRITPEGNVYTVLQLSATQVSYQYYLSVSPADGHLYISNPEKHQVLRALSLEPVTEPAINCEPVVGSGERCIPGDETHCGDGGPARDAKLAHPKGLAIAADKTMYIADGTNIRAVDPKGIIHTLVGHHGHHNHWTPVPCHGAIPAQQAQLQWPTGLSLSPLDGSLHFIDDRLVLKLTDDLKVKVVAGTPLHCHVTTGSSNSDHSQHSKQHSGGNNSDNTSGGEPSAVKSDAEGEEGLKATGTVLGSVLALAFSPTGDLFIAESDSRKVNAIRVVDSAGRISDFAGRPHDKPYRPSSCDCNGNATGSPVGTGGSCLCGAPGSSSTAPEDVTGSGHSAASSKETMLSSNAQFTSISALTVSPDGILNVADQGSLHILALEHYLPTHDENGEFRIPYPPTQEVYVFNRYGQHIATRDLTSGKTRYSFLYSKNTSFGKLSTVTDSSGNKILFLRDYSNVVSTIENTQDHKSDLKISGVGFLVKFSEKGTSDIELDYDSTTGLLISRADSRGGGGGETYMYRYGEAGRLESVILPTGETMSLASHLTEDDSLAVQVSTPVQSLSVTMPEQPVVTTLRMKGRGAHRLTIREDTAVSEAASFRNGSFSVHWSWGGHLQSQAVARHPLLELSLPVEAEMLPIWSDQILTLGEGLSNHMHWTYSLVGDVRASEQTLHRELWVNQSRVLGVEFDQATGRETFYDRERQPLLTVTFNHAGLPQSWVPANGGQPVNITYDRFSRVDGWRWGSQSERYSYESNGLLSEISSPQDGTTKFEYNKLNMLFVITLPSGRRFEFQYDEDGGLRYVTLPSNKRHSFSCQPSLGFLRVTYTPPGSLRSYIQHYAHSGALLQTVFPVDGARVIYRYHASGQLAEVLHGDGRSQINYSPLTGFPSELLHSEREFEYRWDYQYVAGLLMEERLDFGAKTGLSNAKFTYEYDSNFRLTGVQGRIGGQNLPEHALAYNIRTGALEQLGQFKVSQPRPNETTVFDGTAIFSRWNNDQYQETQVAVTIHRMEVFRMEFTYDSRSRISQTRTYTRNVGVNTYTNVKNYTWDPDGQLSGVEAQEPWGFRYDDNGNMLSLTYRGNTIPMEYNVMDRIVKFGEGLYRYDNRGLVVQNAREERFHYNAKGLLVRATKRGRFDVRYYYDHLDRLATRKDNYGNVTQFFYTNHQRPNEVSQIYSPRDGKLMSLVYDDRGHLIFAQVYRHKYYVATDQCGTPVMVFNQYGEGIREIMRSPYGHIVYDSNPYLYLPVDFCGGLLDQVTSLVHMPSGKVYDPLIGQWMSPMWEGILDRVANPSHLHLYRFNGNDPINVRHRPRHLTDHQSWLSLLGYNLQNLAPQLYPDRLPGGGLPLSPPGLWGSKEEMPYVVSLRSSIQLRQESSSAFGVASGFLAHLAERRPGDASTLSSPPRSAVKKDTWPPEDFPTTNPSSVFQFRRLGAACDPPFGRGILVSRTPDGKAVISSVPAANAIYRDVFTSVFNQSYLLPFTFFHNAQQDVFFFVKEDSWRASEDRGQLKRLGGQVNTTFHEKEAASGETPAGTAGGKVADLKLHGAGAVVNLRYGTTPEREKQRLLHHAKIIAVRKAWHREKEALRNGFAGSIDWSATEVDEILKVGYASSYDGEYVHDVRKYPELAEDPFNIRFVKKATISATTQDSAGRRRRRKRDARIEEQENKMEFTSYLNETRQFSQLFQHTMRDTSAASLDSDSGNKNLTSLDSPIIVHTTRQTCQNKKHWWLLWTHIRPSC
ncbi:teneurin-a isoform X2 [Cryptotermes secundus]|uniref:teneurin-a isoform X2 n=1 Tax=Cryptotermes secundus TaxID=105785 RepID=UPI000CD7C57D|nr:teneurin-a isoform X2 [Cryptotermes secundus]